MSEIKVCQMCGDDESQLDPPMCCIKHIFERQNDQEQAFLQLFMHLEKAGVIKKQPGEDKRIIIPGRG